MVDSKVIIALLILIAIAMLVVINILFLAPSMEKILGVVGMLISWVVILIAIIFIVIIAIKAM